MLTKNNFESKVGRSARLLTFILTLLIQCACFHADAATNRIPKEIPVTPVLYRDIYVIDSDRDIVCKTISNKTFSNVTLSPGDTVYINFEVSEQMVKESLSESERKKGFRAAIISATPLVYAFVPEENISWVQLRTPEEAKKYEDYERERAELKKFSNLLIGEQDFPFNPFYSYIVIVFAIIITTGMKGKADEYKDSNLRKARIQTTLTIIFLLLIFLFQTWLYFNGANILTKMVKGDNDVNPLLSMIRMFGFGLFTFGFTIYEIYLMYSVLKLSGKVFGGRTSYTLTGALIWAGGIITWIILYFFYTDRLIEFSKIFCLILVADILFTLLLSLKSPITILFSLILYPVGCTAVVGFMVTGTLLTSWLIIVVIAATILYSFFNTFKVVGYIKNGFGEIIGEIYNCGTGYIYGKGDISSSEVDRLRR